MVVVTDLDPGIPAERDLALSIIDGVNASGATFVPNVKVVFADGTTQIAAALTGVDPYAP